MPDYSPTYFQTKRNLLIAEKNRAHVAYLTYPENVNLRKAYLDALNAEDQFLWVNRVRIEKEIKAGHRDNHVPRQAFQAPGVSSARTASIRTDDGLAGASPMPSPYYRDTLAQWDEMVRKSATDLVNFPGSETERAYQRALNARMRFSRSHATHLDWESGSQVFQLNGWV